MTGDTYEKAMALLKRHEAILFKPYRDSVGKLTIGIGRNLDDVGISSDEVALMFSNDLDRAIYVARSIFSSFDAYTPNRQIGLLDMAFNLNNRLREFKKTIQFILEGNWEAASREMLNSKWAEQVGNRAVEDSELIRKG